MKHPLKIEEQPNPEDVATVRQGLYEYNHLTLAIPIIKNWQYFSEMKTKRLSADSWV